jgi:UDP-galactopyranose mutase
MDVRTGRTNLGRPAQALRGIRLHGGDHSKTRLQSSVGTEGGAAISRSRIDAASDMPGSRSDDRPHDLVCLSHLRWDFVYQRPQHLMSRCAQSRRVFYVEEPLYGEGPPGLDVTSAEKNLWVAVPRLPLGLDSEEAERMQAGLLDQLFAEHAVERFVSWYYTPMARGFTAHLTPAATIYDCMDELSAFSFAPPALHQRERELFAQADMVFTGGQSLYEAKQHQHPRVHRFPSSVDVSHFGRARSETSEPADQQAIPRPRLGFFGVIDERMDLNLIAGVAEARPDWQIVMIGPVVKIDEADLPMAPNIHYLGTRQYQDLPSYLSGWDVALMPFAQNESTRFISPTKTPEYLAAGVPVVSTPIRDVVQPYGDRGLVYIAGSTDAFVSAVDAALAQRAAAGPVHASWLAHVDAYLAGMSWDHTWQAMESLLEGAIAAHEQAHAGASV